MQANKITILGWLMISLFFGSLGWFGNDIVNDDGFFQAEVVKEAIVASPGDATSKAVSNGQERDYKRSTEKKSDSSLERKVKLADEELKRQNALAKNNVQQSDEDFEKAKILAQMEAEKRMVAAEAEVQRAKADRDALIASVKRPLLSAIDSLNNKNNFLLDSLSLTNAVLTRVSDSLSVFTNKVREDEKSRLANECVNASRALNEIEVVRNSIRANFDSLSLDVLKANTTLIQNLKDEIVNLGEKEKIFNLAYEVCAERMDTTFSKKLVNHIGSSVKGSRDESKSDKNISRLLLDKNFTIDYVNTFLEKSLYVRNFSPEKVLDSLSCQRYISLHAQVNNNLDNWYRTFEYVSDNTENDALENLFEESVSIYADIDIIQGKYQSCSNILKFKDNYKYQILQFVVKESDSDRSKSILKNYLLQQNELSLAKVDSLLEKSVLVMNVDGFPWLGVFILIIFFIVLLLWFFD